MVDRCHLRPENGGGRGRNGTGTQGPGDRTGRRTPGPSGEGDGGVDDEVEGESGRTETRESSADGETTVTSR